MIQIPQCKNARQLKGPLPSCWPECVTLRGSLSITVEVARNSECRRVLLCPSASVSSSILITPCHFRSPSHASFPHWTRTACRTRAEEPISPSSSPHSAVLSQNGGEKHTPTDRITFQSVNSRRCVQSPFTPVYATFA